MKVMIHACPKRLWYVDRYLAPSLVEQGLEPVIWNDAEGYGNLASCLRSFRAGLADWHLQDDVLIARNFGELSLKYDHGVVNGFCHTNSRDNPACVGEVYPPDLWHGFPCIRVPIDMALEFCDWVEGPEHDETQWYGIKHNKCDDFLFHEFFNLKHAYETAHNISMVEHVDWLIGGSTVNQWRGYICRSDLWTDEALVDELREKLKNEKMI